MKYLILLLFLVSCSMKTINQCDNWYIVSPPSELQKTDKVTIFNWCVKNISYKSYANGFHPAQQTLDEQTGNCANISLLVLALDNNINGSHGDLILCCHSDNILHYTPRIDGEIIEPGITQIFQVIKWNDIPEYIYLRQ